MSYKRPRYCPDHEGHNRGHVEKFDNLTNDMSLSDLAATCHLNIILMECMMLKKYKQW